MFGGCVTLVKFYDLCLLKAKFGFKVHILSLIHI